MSTILPVKQVTIKWSRQYNYDKVFNKDCVSGIGIYCVSAISALQETIVYIGITDTSFYSRLNEHDKSWLNRYNYYGKLKVRFGIITSPETHSRELIEGVEGGLIYQMQPIENILKKNIPTKNKYKIKNTGSRGLIPDVINMEEHRLIKKDPTSLRQRRGWHNPTDRTNINVWDY